MNNKILIAYYSHSGNTAKIAKLIQEKTGGDLVEIKPLTPYPAEYSGVLRQAKEEIGKGYMPPVQQSADMTQYDTIIAGTPNWCGTLAPPVASFLKSNDTAGKKIAIFVTHGGGGPGHTAKDAAVLCPEAEALPFIDVYGSGSNGTSAQIEEWIKKLGV